jgi:hypothetical protein
MDNIITTWTYQKGELAEKRFFNTIIIFALQPLAILFYCQMVMHSIFLQKQKLAVG